MGNWVNAITRLPDHPIPRSRGTSGERLRQRRRRMVRAVLIEEVRVLQFGTRCGGADVEVPAPRRLVAIHAVIGFGEEQLKNPYSPFSGENRRVQFVNVAAPVAER